MSSSVDLSTCWLILCCSLWEVLPITYRQPQRHMYSCTTSISCRQGPTSLQIAGKMHLMENYRQKFSNSAAIIHSSVISFCNLKTSQRIKLNCTRATSSGLASSLLLSILITNNSWDKAQHCFTTDVISNQYLCPFDVWTALTLFENMTCSLRS